MALGTNRDYKTTHNRAARNLRMHNARMLELVKQGMDMQEASTQAYEELNAHKLNEEGRLKNESR